MALDTTHLEFQTIDSFTDKLFGKDCREIKMKAAMAARNFMAQFGGISPPLDFYPKLFESMGLITAEEKDRHTRELSQEKIDQIRAGKDYSVKIVNDPLRQHDHMDSESFSYVHRNLKFVGDISKLIKRQYIDSHDFPTNSVPYSKETHSLLAEAHLYELTELFHRMNAQENKNIPPLEFASNSIADIHQMAIKQIEDLPVTAPVKNSLLKLAQKRSDQAQGIDLPKQKIGNVVE